MDEKTFVFLADDEVVVLGAEITLTFLVDIAFFSSYLSSAAVARFEIIKLIDAG